MAYGGSGSLEGVKEDVTLDQVTTVVETGKIAEKEAQDPKGRETDQPQMVKPEPSSN